eukprot:814621-Amphidinium_carterae.1
MEAVATGLVSDAAESGIVEPSNLEALGAVSDHQRIEVERMLLDAEVSFVSKFKCHAFGGNVVFWGRSLVLVAVHHTRHRYLMK